MQIPSATYRIQFHPQFKLSDAARLIPYLHDLGISHIYASPLLKSQPGSDHGYDSIDPTQIDPELGGSEEFQRFVEELHRYDMGLLLDIAPNHMAASDLNPWWMNVLENGRESKYAEFFDIDWEARAAKSPELMRGCILLPALLEPYERMLVEQRILLEFDEDGISLNVAGRRYPIYLPSARALLDLAIAKLDRSPLESQSRMRLSELRELIGRPEARSQARCSLRELYLENSEVRRALDDAIREFNGTKGDAASFSRLDALISLQHYRLAFWRTGRDEVNYRRFFGLNEFVALREEDLRVFESVHAFTFRLIAEGQVNGLRIDHIDGLRDPLAYLKRLQACVSPQQRESGHSHNLYAIVEKITSGTEALPAEWPVAGTTGYDFANAVNTLFVDAGGSRELESIYREYTGVRSSFTEAWYVRKRQVMEELFEADIRSLSSLLARLATLDVAGRDLPMHELVRGLKEITARLAVYRTYCRDFEPSFRDRQYLEEAIGIARLRTPPAIVSTACFDFLERLFLMKAGPAPPAYASGWLDFVKRWQEFTGSVMAKGFEDTAFFVHHGLISLNEVGANPFRRQIRFGVNAFHEYNQRTAASHPHTLNATSTHDTKWSEDARARINVLSEIPGEWKSSFARWSELNRAQKAMLDRVTVPSANEEILLYQSMLAIWPFEPLDQVDLPALAKRIDTFMLKAMREAKTHSNWISPNEQHEAALRGFVAQILDPTLSNEFLADFSEFARRIAVYGAANGYAQSLLKLTSPGVPDIYQGAELWRLSLTDPDNRRPVSYSRRTEFLEQMKGMRLESPEQWAELLRNWDDGRLKLWLTRTTLIFRREHRELFDSGAYVPIRAGGRHYTSVCSFARTAAQRWLLVAVPRLVSHVVGEGKFPLGDAWGDTTLKIPSRAPATWRNLFTGENLNTGAHAEKWLLLSDIFRNLPFALLEGLPA